MTTVEEVSAGCEARAGGAGQGEEPHGPASTGSPASPASAEPAAPGPAAPAAPPAAEALKPYDAAASDAFAAMLAQVRAATAEDPAASS